MAFGEQLITVKDFLLRPQFIYSTVATQTINIPIFNEITPNVQTADTTISPYWDYFCSYYAAWRGGSRIHIRTPLPVNFGCSATIIHNVNSLNNQALSHTDTTDAHRTKRHLGKTTIHPLALGDEAIVTCHYSSPHQFILTNRITHHQIPSVLITPHSTSTTDVIYYDRSVADDFTFHKVIGPPAVYYRSTNLEGGLFA